MDLLLNSFTRYVTINLILLHLLNQEIIGGYNPIIWRNPDDVVGEWGITKDSFIFSFKNKNGFKDAILSNVNNMNQALLYHREFGPSFDIDLFLSVTENDDSR